MTEELIKQNAEKYATECYGEYDEHDYTDHSGSNMCHAVSEKAFIAGAHSRDEEIERIKNEATTIMDEACALKVELDRLRNPWISVEDRLPEKIKNKGVSKYVFVIWPDGTRGEAYYNYEEYKAPRWEIKGAGVSRPLAWMPIPKFEVK